MYRYTGISLRQLRRNIHIHKSDVTPVALTIGGSDSSGGAGIQADLKTFSSLGVYGCSVVTALTAQNTLGFVQGIFDVNPDFIRQQIDSVFSDLDVKAVKVGMLHQPQIISAVSEAMDKYKPQHLVLDPVMFSFNEKELLEQEAFETLKTELLPKATLITPNIRKAATLLGRDRPVNHKQMENMLKPLLEFGCKAVLLNGGYFPDDNDSERMIYDIYFDGDRKKHVKSKWITDGNIHGKGSTYSAAITAYLAKGYTVDASILKAKRYITGAIAHAVMLHKGDAGPVYQFWR